MRHVSHWFTQLGCQRHERQVHHVPHRLRGHERHQEVLDLSHTPGQDMAPVKAGAPADCTVACHLANGTTNTHVAHTDRPTTCTMCHPLTVSATNAGGSPHHTAKVPVTTTISLKITPTSIKLKKSVKSTGAVTPVDELVGVRVFLKAEMKKGTTWAKARPVQRR